jgi:translation initiation factor 1
MGKRTKGKKIHTNPSPTKGLGNPFAALEGLALPPGPAVLPELEMREVAPLQVRKRGRVVLRREKSRRGGKTVVVVSDFEPQITDTEIEDLARRVRKTCGCGGTVTGREIEVQGDQPARVAAFFSAEGFRPAGVVS